MTNYVQVLLKIKYRAYPDHDISNSSLRRSLEYYKNMHLPKPVIQGMIDKKVPFELKGTTYFSKGARYESINIRNNGGLLKLYFENDFAQSSLWPCHKNIRDEGFYPKCRDAKFLDKYGEFSVIRLTGRPHRI